MSFLNCPNLPEGPVKLAVVDERISSQAEESFYKLGVRLLKIKPHKNLYEAVRSHPDMMLHHIADNEIVYAPGTDAKLLRALMLFGFKLISGENELYCKYPNDIAYNVARVGNKYFHNLRYTDPVIANRLCELGIEPVHVEQGYSKCSVLPIDENSIITSDAGIAKAAEKKGLEVLSIENESSILLPGLNYGFIGGAGGMLGKTLCAFNGNLNKLNNARCISEFLERKRIAHIALSDGYVTDIGSILPLMI